MTLAYVCTDRLDPHAGSDVWARELARRLRGLTAGPDRATLFVAHPLAVRARSSDAFVVHHVPVPAASGAEAEADAIAANGTLGRLLLREGPFRAVYERYSPFSFAAMEVARLMRIPGILEVGAPLVEERLRSREIIDVGSARVALARALRAASFVVAASVSTAAHLASFPESAGKVRVASKSGLHEVRDIPHLPRAIARSGAGLSRGSRPGPGKRVTGDTRFELVPGIEALASGLLCPLAAPSEELMPCAV